MADTQTLAPRPPQPVKMVVSGGFGVGKTTAIASVSEIEPLTTEAAITEVAAGVDDLSMTPRKTTTTVAMDFGCLTLDPTLKLYIFGTPGQDRFGFMWKDVTQGALGALVVVELLIGPHDQAGVGIVLDDASHEGAGGEVGLCRHLGDIEGRHSAPGVEGVGQLFKPDFFRKENL